MSYSQSNLQFTVGAPWNAAVGPNYTVRFQRSPGFIAGSYFDVVTNANPPQPPTNLLATAGDTKVTLAWSPSGGASTYNIKRATTHNGPYATIATQLVAPTYVDTGRTNGTTYYYVVSASNSFGTSADSSEVSATPQHVRVVFDILPDPPLGFLPDAYALPGWMDHTVPMDSSDAPGGGPSSAISVSLPFGVAQIDTGPDLVVDNPFGGAIAFERQYRTALAVGNISSPGLPAGWTHNWDYRIVPLQPSAWGPVQLVYPNGASETLTPNMSGGTPTGTFQTPIGAPYIVAGVPSTTVGKWDFISLKQNGASQQIFQIDPGDSCYRLHLVVLPNTSQMTLAYSSGKLTGITSSMTGFGSTASMTLGYGGPSSMLNNIQGTGAAPVWLHYTGNLLTGVSCLDGAFDQWTYNYSTVSGRTLITSVDTADSPSSHQTAAVNYDTTTGGVANQVDANGTARTYSYGYGSTTSQTVQSGVVKDQYSVNFDSLGRCTRCTNAAGVSASVQYSGIDPSAVDVVQAPGSNSMTVARDAHGNPTQYGYPFGNKTVITWEYPSNALLGRVTSVQDVAADGTVKSTAGYTYYSVTNPATGSFAGAVATATSPASGTTTYTYTAMGNVKTATGPTPDGLTGTLVYDYVAPVVGSVEKFGKPVKITDPLGRFSTISYDSSGRISTQTDPLNRQTTYHYNSYDQTTSVDLPMARGVKMSYAVPGKAPSSVGWRYNTSLISDPTRTMSTTTYDKEYGVKGVTDIVGHNIQTGLDQGYDLKSYKHYNSSTAIHSFTYNPFNMLGTATNGTGSGGVKTNTSCVATGQLTDWTKTNAYTGAEYTYGTISYLAEDGGMVSQAQFNKSGMVTDPGLSANNQLSTGGPSFEQYTYTYDKFGRVATAWTTTTGHAYTYDGADRVLTDQVTAGGDTRTLTYTYNQAGARSTMQVAWTGAQSVTYTYSYNKVGDLTQITVNAANFLNPQVFNYDYDAADRVIACRTGQATVLYTYDDLDHIIKVLNLSADDKPLDPNVPAQYRYQEPGNGKWHTLYSVFDPVTYDDEGKRTGFTFTYLAGAGATYAWKTGTAAFAYTNERLTSETYTQTGSPNVTLNHAYDYADNLTTIRNATNFIDTASDQMTGTNAPGYGAMAFDTNGNQLTGRGQTYTYGPDDRLSSAPFMSFAAYDTAGWRSSNGGTNATGYTYDGDAVVSQRDRDGAGAYDTYYVWGPTGLVGKVYGGASTTYLFDPNGSVFGLAGGGATVATPLLDGYGLAVWGGTQAGTPFRYKGQAGYYTDQSGLVYCHNRFYDPYTGRWLSRDPIGLEGGANTYCYCSGDPINGIDPSGLDFQIGDMLFTGEGFLSGIKTGGCALLHAFSFGHFNDKWAQQQPGYQVSVVCGEVAKEALLQIAGEYVFVKAGQVIAKGAEAYRAWKSAKAMAKVRQVGAAGERAVQRIANIGAKERLYTTAQNGMRKWRVPDGIDHDLHTVNEIKNVKTLDFTGQIRDMLNHRPDGYSFNLYVRRGTILSKKLLDMEKDGLLFIHRVL
ncbi:MAG: hypothetical protein JSS65_14930 [Armatimonadetes bacterium]|nr:hypothetical protein [Armatimonadota bacterium]